MDNVKILKSILLVKAVEESIRDNENIIFEIIPTLKYEKGFDQKSVWHSYDVWNHTIKAISSSNVDFETRLVLLLHDIGKPFSYQDDGDIRHFKGHALKSKEISKPILEAFGYKDNELNKLLFLIGEHAATINVADVDDKNIELYNNLLTIQFCDASAYEPSHAKKIIKNLIEIQKKLKNKKYKDM